MATAGTNQIALVSYPYDAIPSQGHVGLIAMCALAVSIDTRRVDDRAGVGFAVRLLPRCLPPQPLNDVYRFSPMKVLQIEDHARASSYSPGHPGSNSKKGSGVPTAGSGFDLSH